MAHWTQTLLTMSLSASLVALAVMAVRFFLPKLPRALVCLLWLVVFFRMACPVSFQLPVSLIPQGVADGSAAQLVLDSSDPVSASDPATEGAASPEAANPASAGGGPSDDLPEVSAAAPGTDPLPVSQPLGPKVVFGIWGAGTLLALAWAGLCYHRFRRRTAEAVKAEDKVYETDQIPSPFVLGMFRPKIYLPVGLDPQDRRYVLLHEQAHLRRRDNLTKPLAYLIVCFHWFNPILWAAYRLLCLDIETACDQAVLRQFPRGQGDDTAAYAAALLHLSREPGVPSAVPLAFGEEDAKGRIEALLQYKRPAVWVFATALTACLLAAVCLAANPTKGIHHLSWHTFSQGAVISQGEPVPLPEELLDDALDMLRATKHSAYTPCEDPGLPEGTLVLSREKGDLEYRLISTHADTAYLVQIRHEKAGDTYRAAQLDGNLTHYRKNLRNTVYRRWVTWWGSVEPLLSAPSADALYAMAPSSGEDLAGCAALLDQLGVREALGPYELSLQREPDGETTLVLALEQTPADFTQAQKRDSFLNGQGPMFLALVPDLYYLAWYSLDSNVGARISRHSLLPYEEPYSLEQFRFLYPQRHLWWWHTLSSPNITVFCPTLSAMYHPAYSVSHVIYPAGAYSYTDPFNEFFFVSDLGFAKTGRGSLSFTAVRTPLADTSLPNPDDPSTDLLDGRTVQAAWYFHAEAVAGAPVPDPWTQKDTGYRLYETEDGPYLARWSPADGTGWTLDYVLKLKEKALSFDSSSVISFYDEYMDPFTESLDLYHQEGD